MNNVLCIIMNNIFDIIIFTRINRGVSNQIHVSNTDPLLILLTLYNNRGINNCSIIISNKNSTCTICIYINIINYNMHAIYLLLNLCFNNNIKFKFKLYSNYIKIVYIII